MTPEEAIKTIQVAVAEVEWNYPMNYAEAFETAIEALEKQIPKKPIFWENKYYFSPSPNDDWGYECPCCGNQDIDYPDHHCECGQALDWRETE